MNYYSYRSKLVSAVTLLIAGTCYAGAQSSASVVGQVIDKNYSQYLEGVTVRVKGESSSTSTNRFGEYTLHNLPAGEQTLVFYYVGYPVVSREVTLEEGSSTELAVSLGENIVELDEFIVNSSASAFGQARAINQQKNADGIINIISEESFGAILDGNVGQALQRMPGISVDEGQDGSPTSINIRGVSGEYNSVQVDGNRIPTSGGSRSFDPRMISADSVTNVEIIKAPTPDRDGDAIGGIVNLVTRSAFEREGREMKLTGAAIWNEEPNEWGSSFTYEYTDLFSVNGETNNLGISFTLSMYDTDRYSENADQDWVKVDAESNPELGLDDYDDPVWFMESTHFEHDTTQTKNYAIGASIDYQIDDHNSIYFRPNISRFEREGVSYETDIDIDTEFENEADGNKTYAVLTPRYGRGSEDSEASRGWIGTLDEQDNMLYSFSLGGVNKQETSELAYDFYYSDNTRTVDNDTELNMLMEPEDPWFIFEYEVIDPEGDVRVDVVNGVDSTDLSQMTEGELEIVNSEKTEEVYSTKVDWTKVFHMDESVFTLKTGAKYRVSDQVFDQAVDLYEMDESFPYADVVEETDEVLFMKQKYYNVQPQAGLDLHESSPDLFEFVVDNSLEDSNIEDYDATEKTKAAYVMGTYEYGRHTIIAGVRWEKNSWSNKNKIVTYNDDDDVSVDIVKHDNSYDFWLPGIHFRHELDENWILRESYNRSYGRPRLEDLSRGRWVDDDGNIEEGNPDLEPAISDNFDIQLEYYTDKGGLYSIGFFYKDIEDFSYTQVSTFNDLDSDGNPIIVEDGDLEYERTLNGSSATNYGLELIARQRLYFLPEGLNGLSLAISATFTESDADYPNREDDRDLPLEGFSEEIFTVTLDYEWNKFMARIDYRYRDDYIEGLGDDIESDEFYASEYRLDAEMAYQVSEGLLLFVTGTNLTNQPQISYQGYSQFVEDASFSGSKYTFGAEYAF